MPYFIFTAITTFTVLALSPVLSSLGMSVCPVIEDYGFIPGCIVNLKFVSLILLWALSSGNLLIYLRKKSLLPKISYFEPTVLASLFFMLTSFAWIYQVRKALYESLSINTESGNSDLAASLILVVGPAVVFLVTALLDTLIVQINENKNYEIKHQGGFNAYATEIWNIFLIAGAPLFIFISYFYFSISILFRESTVDGWSTLPEIKSNTKYTALYVFLWYAVHLTIVLFGRRKLINKLTGFAKQLSQMDASSKVSLERLATLAPVGYSLNRSGEVLSERKRLISGFSKFVSDNLIEKIVTSDEIQLQGQNVNACVMMTDLRDFTTLSSSMRPEQVVKMLNIYFDEMLQILHSNGILVDKFIGDGLLAYITEEEDSREIICSKMVQSAQQMLEKMTEVNRKLKELELPELKLGVGIHFGSVVLGSMGSKSRMQYTIIGDTVNRTARIEGLCKELKSNLIVSDEVFKLLNDSLKTQFQKHSNVHIKGIDTGIDVFAA